MRLCYTVIPLHQHTQRHLPPPSPPSLPLPLTLDPAEQNGADAGKRVRLETVVRQWDNMSEVGQW